MLRLVVTWQIESDGGPGLTDGEFLDCDNSHEPALDRRTAAIYGHC